jgi:hypothetical protein
MDHDGTAGGNLNPQGLDDCWFLFNRHAFACLETAAFMLNV